MHIEAGVAECWADGNLFLGSNSALVLACKHLPALRNHLGCRVTQNEDQFLSRRSLLKTMGLAPLILRPAPLHGSSFVVRTSRGLWQLIRAAFPLSDVRLTPRYPATISPGRRPPPGRPGSDEFVTEKYAFEIEALLQQWSQTLRASARDLSALAKSLDPSIEASRWFPKRKSRCAQETGSSCKRRRFNSQVVPGRERFLSRSGRGWDQSRGWKPRSSRSPVSKKLQRPVGGSARHSL